MKPDGASLIGFGSSAPGGAEFHAFNPATGSPLEPAFAAATAADVARAVELAAEAAPLLAARTGTERGQLLRAIAAKLEAAAGDLAVRGNLETALPPARCQGEIARTVGQLRLFAGYVEKGDWADARIETALPDRKPLPRPDHRSVLRPLGPVVVFGASNFPYAFSVAGGDTAAALAAGCPVIVKAHSAHPGTGEMVGRLAIAAVREGGFPEGTLSVIFGSGADVGQALVRHPEVKAVGFTGSRQGGTALMKIAAARPEPIPVYAEMSSVNPVFILPGAIRARGAALVEGLAASVTLGVGQFCTNPGLVFVEANAESDAWVKALGEKLAGVAPATMLTKGICQAYWHGISERATAAGIREVARAGAGAAGTAAPVLFAVEAAEFLAHPELAEEIFGPSTLVVRYARRADLPGLAARLAGQLTATIHAEADEPVADLVAAVSRRAGRIVLNGFPTGVEVSHAMVHGGPYPATSDGRSTSVGSQAILRFVRPVCYQNFPDAALPPELRNANPLGLLRLVNGESSRSSI